MVGKRTIKELDFETIEDYFEYILDSVENGQHKQARNLYADLSGRQKEDFRDWFVENGVETSTKGMNEYIKSLKQ